MALSRLSANLSMRRGWARRRSSAIHAAQAAEAVSLRLETKLFEPALTADAGEIASPEGLRALIEAAWREARRETLGRWCRFRTAMVTSLRRSRSVQLAERLRPPNQARFVLALQFGDHGRAIPTRLTGERRGRRRPLSVESARDRGASTRCEEPPSRKTSRSFAVNDQKIFLASNSVFVPYFTGVP